VLLPFWNDPGRQRFGPKGSAAVLGDGPHSHIGVGGVGRVLVVELHAAVGQVADAVEPTGLPATATLIVTAPMKSVRARGCCPSMSMIG
jgi:hypothetical protein